MVRLHNVNRSFSLTEVLLAVGILAVGMIFIAGVFPAGIHFTTIATERSIAAVVADEAFAKIRLYGIDLSKLSGNKLENFNNDVLPATVDIDPNEFAYPSTGTDITPKQYFWSALCGLVEDDPNNRLVQVTVFVCRRVSPNLKYPDPDGIGTVNWPMPVPVDVSQGGKGNELEIDGPDQITFINDGYTIVDNETGRIYRVLERYRDVPGTILLDSDWEGSSPDTVWVVPPPVTGGRYPCIAVYQKVIRF